MVSDSPLLLQEMHLKRGEEWAFPGSGWTFLWLQSGEGYLMGCTPPRALSNGMLSVHGATCPLRLRASQLGDLIFRWFRLDPSNLFGVFTLFERRRIDHPDQVDPPLPWVLAGDHPATQRFQDDSLTDDTCSLRQRARLLELVSAVLSPPPFRSSTPVGSPGTPGIVWRNCSTSSPTQN